MSGQLRGDTAVHMCETRLQSVPFLVHPDLEPEFLCSLAIRFEVRGYSRLETVPCDSLFIVERGVVAKRGRLGLAGACFGVDVILSNALLRDDRPAIALTFLQTTHLGQDDIFRLLPEYPNAYHIVRRAAFRMAFVRAVMCIKRFHHEFGLGGVGGLGGRRVGSAVDMGLMFDRALQREAEVRQTRELQALESRQRIIPMTLKDTATVSRADGGSSRAVSPDCGRRASPMMLARPPLERPHSPKGWPGEPAFQSPGSPLLRSKGALPAAAVAPSELAIAALRQQVDHGALRIAEVSSRLGKLEGAVQQVLESVHARANFEDTALAYLKGLHTRLGPDPLAYAGSPKHANLDSRPLSAQRKSRPPTNRRARGAGSDRHTREAGGAASDTESEFAA